MATNRAHCDQLIDYFNGHLSGEEKKAFEEHLNTCTECQEELNEWNALIDELPYDSEPVTPPEGMKERTLAAVFKEDETSKAEKDDESNQTQAISPFTHAEKAPVKKFPSKKWVLPAAAAFLLSLGGNVFLFNQLQQQSTELTQSQETIDELMQFVTLSPVNTEEAAPAGTASIVRRGSEVSVVINASSLGPLRDNEVYQVWLIEGDSPDTPQRAGTFVSSETGDGTVVFTMENFNPEQWNTIAISHEPDADSQTPEGEVILASEL
ncbi:anti-sigma factor [Jeotgalibacillus proteolyticus]|uniref:Anti-sigma-W factor RsiW n=1 Tax=Jeotgalibacillus proteolyticus TaxID=2082395 RepID=A0A2S5G7B2_9BACL|nr:anti-sigma factor [Jeotgalibacillus proteolyticus]PPA68868.1 hypothetical protein C4B60_18290 [Jeotgalibacillus proteolyticus]